MTSMLPSTRSVGFAWHGPSRPLAPLSAPLCACSREHVLASRNAEALERMERVDTLVVDKTGTLTEGKPKVVAVIPAPGWDENQIMQLAASLERASEHPLARAALEAAAERPCRT